MSCAFAGRRTYTRAARNTAGPSCPLAPVRLPRHLSSRGVASLDSKKRMVERAVAGHKGQNLRGKCAERVGTGRGVQREVF